MKYKFLVLGHPRTGTGYMSALFRYLGYDVNHEEFGKDGISNWMYAVNNDECLPTWGTTIKRDENEFEHIFLVVRNPYTAIKSIINIENVVEQSLNYRLNYLNLDISGLNEVEIAIYVYHEWLKNIQNQYPMIKIIRLETAKEDLIKYLEENHLDIKFEKEEPSKNHNTRSQNFDYKEADFSSLSKKFQEVLREFCESYGYDYKN